MVDGAARILIVCSGEAPAAIVFRVWLHNAHGQELLQPFQLPCYDHSVRKGAEEAAVEVIAVRLEGKGGSAKLVAPGAISWRMIGHDSG